MTRKLLRGQTAVRAICISAIICPPVISPVAAADMPEPRHRAVELAPAFPSRIIGESEPMTQQRFDAQRTLWKEPHGRNISKVHLPTTTGAATSPRPRSSQTSTTPPSAMTQKETEQLFQEFLEWQKRQ